jgi:hypothetical protein
VCCSYNCCAVSIIALSSWAAAGRRLLGSLSSHSMHRHMLEKRWLSIHRCSWPCGSRLHCLLYIAVQLVAFRWCKYGL